MELKHLGVAWFVEHNLFEKTFILITDNQALLAVVKERCSNKSYKSRLTRWVDGLLYFDFY